MPACDDRHAVLQHPLTRFSSPFAHPCRPPTYPPSTWFGVSCTADLTRVNRTELSDNNLVGTIPDSINGTVLWGFDISGNTGIHGTLKRMPTTIWGMNFAGGLQLEGTIPDHFSELTNLQLLGLPNNTLTGTIPDSLATLPALRLMDLSFNHLTGARDGRGGVEVSTWMCADVASYTILEHNARSHPILPQWLTRVDLRSPRETAADNVC